jgi:hypothetical protein
MCDPTSVMAISIGVSMAGAAASYVSQGKQAKAHSDALVANLRNEYQQAQRQQIWHNEQASQKLEANSKAWKAMQGTQSRLNQIERPSVLSTALPVAEVLVGEGLHR